MRRAVTVLAMVVLLTPACASKARVTDLDASLEALRTEITALRDAHDRSTAELARTVGDLKRFEQELDALAQRIAGASGAADELRGRITAVERDLQQIRLDLDARPVTTQAPAKPAPVSSDTAPYDRDAESAYAAAVATFHARERGQAVLEFLDFLAKYPAHPLSANAQYWIGEAYYAERDYRQALVEFEKVLEGAGQDGKAAEALLKIGLCYRNLREDQRADEAWRRLMREYPASEAAARARALLARGTPAR